MVNQELKTRETRLRRMAQRQGLALVKSRMRDPHGSLTGTYGLAEVETRVPVLHVREGVGVSLDQVESYLKGDRA